MDNRLVELTQIAISIAQIGESVGILWLNL